MSGGGAVAAATGHPVLAAGALIVGVLGAMVLGVVPYVPRISIARAAKAIAQDAAQKNPADAMKLIKALTAMYDRERGKQGELGPPSAPS